MNTHRPEATAPSRAGRERATGRGPAAIPEQPVGDTRARIQTVALELFSEHGYERTSLREIAERLGVTKAALYYHFATKDDIINSLIEDRVARLEELLAWAREQPRTHQARCDVVRRYAADLQAHRHHEVVRFFERNQTAIKGMPAAERMRDRLMSLIDVLADHEEPPATRLRRSLAIFAVHASWFLLRDPDLPDDERRAAALEVALDLVGGPEPPELD